MWVSLINRDLYGPRWARHCSGVRWIRALELQRRDVIHYHALVGGDDVHTLRRLSWMDEWDRLAGYARIEPPRGGGEAVRRYVSKYVVKGGEIELGGPGMYDLPASRWPSTICRTPLDREAERVGADDLVRDQVRPLLTPAEYDELLTRRPADLVEKVRNGLGRAGVDLDAGWRSMLDE